MENHKIKHDEARCAHVIRGVRYQGISYMLCELVKRLFAKIFYYEMKVIQKRESNTCPYFQQARFGGESNTNRRS
jgi:hypothetical protein